MTNREIDALVAEKVMGLELGGELYTNDPLGTVRLKNRKLIPEYSTDIQDAWDVVEYMQGSKWNFWLQYSDDGPSIWEARFILDDVSYSSHDFDNPRSSAPMAICLAALRAHGVEV